MSTRPPPASALEALSCQDWDTFNPRLVAAATGHLHGYGLAGDELRRSYIMEPEELVSAAVERILNPRRRWDPRTGKNEENLFKLLDGAMSSVAWNVLKSARIARRSAVDPQEVCDQLEDESPSPSRELAAREQVTHIAEVLADDPEALAVYREVDAEREEIADALGVDVKHVKAVRLRAKRRLDALRISLDDDGGPPESEE